MARSDVLTETIKWKWKLFPPHVQSTVTVIPKLNKKNKKLKHKKRINSKIEKTKRNENKQPETQEQSTTLLFGDCILAT